jgi:hypothetical protein
MTAIRKLALQILNVAVRHAAPAAQDWGTAMLRELDFVEGDLDALFWALGSATVLFKHLEVPMSVPSMFERFRTALAFLWILTTVCILLLASIKLLYNPHFQVGVGLIQLRGFMGLLTTIPAIPLGHHCRSTPFPTPDNRSKAADCLLFVLATVADRWGGCRLAYLAHPAC